MVAGRALAAVLVPESVLGVAGRRWKSAADAVRDRRATGHGDRAHPALRRLPELVQTGPPSWRQRTIDPARTLSWVSPSCAPSGRVLAAAAGPSNAGDAGFGGEHRSIWLLRPDGHPIRRLTDPPAPGLSDEAPRFSRDGHWILFVRIRNHLPNPVTGPSFSEDTIKLTRASGTGRAIPIADFTSDDVSYYDHFDWPDGIAWYQPVTSSRAQRSRCSTSDLREPPAGRSPKRPCKTRACWCAHASRPGERVALLWSWPALLRIARLRTPRSWPSTPRTK